MSAIVYVDPANKAPKHLGQQVPGDIQSHTTAWDAYLEGKNPGGAPVTPASQVVTVTPDDGVSVVGGAIQDNYVPFTLSGVSADVDYTVEQVVTFSNSEVETVRFLVRGVA